MEDTVAQINQELSSNSHVRSCKLVAVIRDGEITVVGKVHSYFQKQIAIHTAQKCLAKTFTLRHEIVVDPERQST